MAIDLRDLEGELSRTRRKFDEWAFKLQEAAIDTQHTHLQNMQDQSGEYSQHQMSDMNSGYKLCVLAMTGKSQSMKARCQQLQEVAKQVKQRKLYVV